MTPISGGKASPVERWSQVDPWSSLLATYGPHAQCPPPANKRGIGRRVSTAMWETLQPGIIGFETAHVRRAASAV
ncbi:MAG: hypothetical protein FJ037_04865 [Chloroflexi bacterium]|nr:hypothetical protein [Chloroflexota bacterium]